jgi:hypothetical protein
MKANKKMYPGGGMLRNKYAQGGAVDKFRQSIMSNPGVVSLKKSVKSLPKAGMTAEQKSRMSGLRGAMSAMAAQSAGYSPAAMSARATARPSVKPASPVSRDMVMKFNPENLDPREMADRFAKTGGGPIDEVTDIMFRSGMPIRYRTGLSDQFLTLSDRDTTETPMSPGATTAKTAGASVSFSKAFADARAKGLKEFTWNGKKYTTQIKGGGTEKPQATRNAEPVSKMPMKAVASVTKPYFESPTGVMQPASVKTTEMRGATVQKMPMKTTTQVSASTDKGSRYFKPGTMAEYLEERRRKMQSNLMTKR